MGGGLEEGRERDVGGGEGGGGGGRRGMGTERVKGIVVGKQRVPFHSALTHFVVVTPSWHSHAAQLGEGKISVNCVTTPILPPHPHAFTSARHPQLSTSHPKHPHFHSPPPSPPAFLSTRAPHARIGRGNLAGCICTDNENRASCQDHKAVLFHCCYSYCSRESSKQHKD